jgi:hypothetical protein
MIIFRPGVKISEKQADKGFEATGMLGMVLRLYSVEMFQENKEQQADPFG